MNSGIVDDGRSACQNRDRQTIRNKQRGWRSHFLTLVGAIVFTSGASAADIYTPLAPETKVLQTESGWTFSVMPYVWAAGLSGETSQFGLPTIDLDWSFNNILDHLDVAAMAMAEARYDRYSVFVDLQYLKLSNDTGTPRGIIASTVSLSTETFAGLIGAGYTVLESSAGNLDLVGGVKIWHVDTDISFSGGLLDGFSRSDGATWADGMVGLRGNYSITPNIYLTGWGFVGTGQADIDWDVAGGVGYQFNDRISALVAYRAAGVDYSDDGFIFDAVQQGPMLGLKVQF